MSLFTDKEGDGNLKISRFRISVVCLVLVSVIVVIIARLLWIQVLHPERLIAEGNARVLRNYHYEPARGKITDRQGKILAISIPVKTVDADPKVLHEKGIAKDKKAIAKLAEILELDPQELSEKIKDPSRRFVHLKHYLDIEKAQLLQEIAKDGIILNDSYRRYYPTGEVNSNLVGILNGDGVGVYGVEQSFNSYLTATATTRSAHKDRYNHVIENLGIVKAGAAGGNLVLSIDNRLQSIAYKALDDAVKVNEAESGCAVLIDVRTGEILAMANSPSFDPNNRSHFDIKNAKNRTITDIFEPGSTMKPIVALAALESGSVNWKEVFDTRPFVVDGKVVRDSHAMNTGTLLDIIKYSSNTGMAHISQRIGPYKIMDMLQRFGFGRKSQSGLVGESAGRLNERRTFWSEIDKATLGLGYGVAVTSLQLASAYATIASGGAYHPISILRVLKPPAATQVANAIEVKRMQMALETVVAAGTGSKAAIERYRVAGKTGTARIATAGGYGKDYMATFAGYAPISSPRFAMVVVITAPRAGKFYGGVVSGPVFQEVMAQALQLYNVPPDREINEEN